MQIKKISPFIFCTRPLAHCQQKLGGLRYATSLYLPYITYLNESSAFPKQKLSHHLRSWLGTMSVGSSGSPTIRYSIPTPKSQMYIPCSSPLTEKLMMMNY